MEYLIVLLIALWLIVAYWQNAKSRAGIWIKPRVYSPQHPPIHIADETVAQAWDKLDDALPSIQSNHQAIDIARLLQALEEKENQEPDLEKKVALRMRIKRENRNLVHAILSVIAGPPIPKPDNKILKFDDYSRK
jgi:hypothetical protein